MSCECYIGIIHDYDNTGMTTLSTLKKHIKFQKEFAEYWDSIHEEKHKFYSLNDYCDKRKSTDLTRFNYCPMCGKKIDWKALKGGVE